MGLEKFRPEARQEGVDAVPSDGPEPGEALRGVEHLRGLHHQQHVLQDLGNGVTLKGGILYIKYFIL